MAADTGRNGVINARSSGGVAAVKVGLHACGDAWNSSNIAIVVGVVHHHELVHAGPVVVVLWRLVLAGTPSPGCAGYINRQDRKDLYPS
eukprot:6194281-Pleurochrysis_carterae.AAC.2